MVARYGSGSNVLATGAIYNSPSRFTPYIGLLIVFKFLRAFGLFLSYDLLKLVHIVQFLFIVKFGAAIFLLFLQKPFTSGPRLTKRQWFRILRHAFFGSTIQLFWIFGLTLCGPVRTILLFEHSDLVVIAAASALFTGQGGSPAKIRGGVFMLLAILGILLFDHDDEAAHQSNFHPEGHHHHSSIITHMFYHAVNWSGLSDHKGGVVMLTLTICLNVGYNTASKKLSVDVGGAKRLHALSTLLSSLLLLPWASFIYFTRESQITVSWIYVLFPFIFVTLLVFILDYYVEAVCVNRLEIARTAKIGAIAIFTSAIFLGCFWNHPFVTHITTMQAVQEIVKEDHVLSGGVIFSFVLFMFSSHVLTNPNKGSKGSLVGYSAGGLPLYNMAEEAFQRTSHSVALVLKNGLKQILEESDSRRIFYFLCMNLFFTFVELVYGVWTNSLGLISDGFHMLFDCSALVMGLYAAVMSRWKATREFSYGYDRVEILSGYINGLFLVVIAFFVFTAALGRLFDPPDINTDRLLVVSVAGLVVNLFGIVAFSHGHSHGGGGGSHGHSHSKPKQHNHSHHGHGHGHHGHGHSHNSHNHSHGEQECSTKNSNMQGVFLHVLADTMGSVGVIISTILIENFGWNIADPICSLFIAFMIFLSVVPLLKDTAFVLLLRSPLEIEESLQVALQKVLSIDGVLSLRKQQFWSHTSSVMCGSIHVVTSPDASEQKIVSQVTAIFKELGVQNLTVQVEKEAYFQHMSGLSSNFDVIVEMTKNIKALNFQDPHSIKAV
ncbi:zinc transporter 5 [Lingula anatina]|uniref:Proton-coupled zinc antiporter SLC30A5 n=1 Tax=Lingula anatina TaxID=7574 RepID=A0A1S3INH0_LINAN|nr:zinc transporter 5 [Lingula anatina]|eukprot:XP_013399446.1 zinc transporter 5 [Lingula anatina]